jgi:hypothetical protein
LLRSLSGRSSTLVSIGPPPYDLAMSKQLTPRKRLKALFPFLRSRRSAGESPPSPNSEKLARQIERVLRRPLRRASKKAKLNLDDQGDRDQLLVWLAWAVYGAKSAGAPKKWTPEKLRLLLADARALRDKDGKLKETACCKLLSKGKGGEGRYQGMNSGTLRRVLYEAKVLDRKAKALAAPLKEVFAIPESTGSAGEKPSTGRIVRDG